MPELPEIEHLKLTLEPVLIGALMSRARLFRPDILTRRNGRRGPSSTQGPRDALLVGGTIVSLARRGKQLAMNADDGRCLCVHLGMSGQLRFVPARKRLQAVDHIHCLWDVKSPSGNGRLTFRDPRRFGGLWSFSSPYELDRERWSRLGPDALTISARALGDRLARTRRPIKAAMLDQSLIAGVGNIYADESLFQAAIHPLTPSSALAMREVRRLATAIRAVLRQAIGAGGSTFRSYIDGNGRAGAFAAQHRVYGRGGQECLRCGERLQTITVAQRTTVACERCQRRAISDRC